MNATLAVDAIEPARFDGPRALSFGLLWGTATSAFATFDLPLDDLDPAQLLAVLVRVVPVYWLQGVALACAAVALERHLTPLRAVALVVAFSVLPLPVSWLVWNVLAMPGRATLPAWGAEPLYAYTVWLNLFANGLFIAAFALNASSERSRSVFARIEIARQQAETWLGAERVRALQGHVDPALLLRAMVEVERRYTQRAASAQRLLDALVSMLRAAMPGVRSGLSTLAAEVLLARQYAALRAELEPDTATWFIRADGALPDLPFPPLLLLPVLDTLVGATEATTQATTDIAELRIAAADGHCTLHLLHAGPGHGPWIGADLLFRLQVGLRTVFGESWTLCINERPSRDAFVLTLPLPCAAAPTATSLDLQESPHE